MHSTVPLEKMPRSLCDLEFIKCFLDALPLGVLVADLEGRITYCNEAQAKIDDMPLDFILGKTESELYGPYLGPGIMRSCQQTGQPILGFVCHYRTVKGKIINGAYWVYPLFEEERVVASLCLTQLLATKSPIFPGAKKSEPVCLQTMSQENDAEGEGGDPNPSSVKIVGSNQAFRKMLSIAQTTASSPSPVLIAGETGCGKEMIVKSIRAASNRYDKPYLAVNCSAIPATLLEGILFGATKGSFTGAIDRPGLFEEANGGIIYLDEIDSMPLELQPKLLRFLQDMRVRRLGSSVERMLDVKVISSIGASPNNVLETGKLRSDLFYRLAVISIRIPPLRERKDDIDDLTAHFMAKYNKILNKQITSLDPTVRQLFHMYDWPGNVRELEHVIAGAINVAAWENTLHMHHIPEHHRHCLKPYTLGNDQLTKSTEVRENLNSLRPSLEIQEEEAIRSALSRTAGHVSNAAGILGISRQLLNYKLKKFNIKRAEYIIKE